MAQNTQESCTKFRKCQCDLPTNTLQLHFDDNEPLRDKAMILTMYYKLFPKYLQSYADHYFYRVINTEMPLIYSWYLLVYALSYDTSAVNIWYIFQLELTTFLKSSVPTTILS